MSEKHLLKVGSRQSELAMIQTNYVINELTQHYPNFAFEIVPMTTKGDQIIDKPLPKIGEKSLFTRELENALLDSEVDFVVHSLKDLPTCLPKGLVVGAILEREDPRDALIPTKSLKHLKLNDLPSQSIIGTSSLRRAAQFRQNHPHLIVESIRGNLNTRLRKLDNDKKYSAIILALAGIKRMGWEDRISEILPADDFLYAVGQGALAVECKENNLKVLELLQVLNHEETILKVLAERSFLQALGGGCTAPLAVKTTIKSNTLTLTGAVWSLDGRIKLEHSMKRHLPEKNSVDEPPKKQIRRDFTSIRPGNIFNLSFEAAFDLGRDLAQHLASMGARDVINDAKTENGSSVNLHVPERESALINNSGLTVC